MLNGVNKLLCVLLFVNFSLCAQPNYLDYHQRVVDAEHLIVAGNYKEALANYQSIFDSYDFIFLKDYKVAAQLAVFVQCRSDAVLYVKRAIADGWTPKKIRKNKLARSVLDSISKTEVDSLIDRYDRRLNEELKGRVHGLYKEDQRMALKAFLKIGKASRTRFAEEKFAPHSEQQMVQVMDILATYGYPGEQLIGNDYWMSTVLSHHNSISTEYNKSDTLYAHIRPALFAALEKGEISPFELALIENWKVASESNHGKASYGYLGPTLDTTTIKTTNELRRRVGLRSIELRNQLVDVQSETGIDFYLSGEPWQKGEITIANE
jgi:hypothetical protein